MSAPSPGALPSIFSLEPGTERQERRGRLRERSDMPKSVVRHLRRFSMDAIAIASAIASTIGMTVVGRMTGGEGPGAYEVRTAEGARAVLKFATGPHLDFEQAARTCEVLRGRGYPAPATLRTGMLDDTRFAVIELLPGEPGAQPDAGARRTRHPARRAPARRRHLGATAVDRRHRLERDGGPRSATASTRRCARTPRRRARCSIACAPSPSPDATSKCRRRCGAHGSRAAQHARRRRLHHGCDRLGGQHDRRRGLRPRHVRLLHASTSGSATRCSPRRVPRTDVRALPLYAAHMTLRQTDWSIRFHDPAAVAWSIGIGTALLAAVGAR